MKNNARNRLKNNKEDILSYQRIYYIKNKEKVKQNIIRYKKTEK